MTENNKQKNILIIISCLIIISIYYSSFYKPNDILIKQKINALKLMKTNLLASKQKVNSLTRLRNTCITYAEKIKLINEIIPKESISFERNIIKLTENSSLKVNSITPLKENSSNYLTTKSLQINMRGSFNSLYNFLTKLENTYKTSSISNLSIVPSNNNELSISCIASFSFLNKEEK